MQGREGGGGAQRDFAVEVRRLHEGAHAQRAVGDGLAAFFAGGAAWGMDEGGEGGGSQGGAADDAGARGWDLISHIRPCIA